MEDNIAFDFSFEVPGQIWQLAVDELTGNIAIEIRDPDQQELFFLLFRIETLEVSDYIEIEEADWWTTLFALKEGLLFLDKYDDQQDPTKKTLLVYDAIRKEMIQSIDDFQIQSFGRDALEGHLASDTKIEMSINFSDIGLAKGRVIDDELVQYPVFFPENSSIYSLAKEYLNIDIALGVEYFEMGTTIIISYYVRSGAKFDRMLLVIRDEDEFVHIKLDRNLNGYASGSFLVIKNYLIFITNANQISGVEI